jgi:hypothetical protein
MLAFISIFSFIAKSNLPDHIYFHNENSKLKLPGGNSLQIIFLTIENQIQIKPV